MEGILKLKQDAGGWRHYIELPNGRHDDIHCGAALEVRLLKWDEAEGQVPDRWLGGRYEANLSRDNALPRARLIIGEFVPYSAYVNWGDVEIILPLGVTVRRPERG